MKFKQKLSAAEPVLRSIAGIIMIITAHPLLAWDWPAWLLAASGINSLIMGSIRVSPTTQAPKQSVREGVC